MDNTEDMIKKGRQKVGEALPYAKLTVEIIVDIRKQLRNKQKLQKDLATEYNIARATVSQIKLGRIWKHVPGAMAPWT